MAYNGGYDAPQPGRSYPPQGAGRPPLQRHFPPGQPQAYGAAPPQQYDQYQDGYGHGNGYDGYGTEYDQGYGGGQYDDGYHRGPPPNQGYQGPPQDYYGGGPGSGRGGLPPMRGGRTGPMRPMDGPRSGPFPPWGGAGSGPARGGPGSVRLGMERAGSSDPTNRRPSGPGSALSPIATGFAGGAFPAFPSTRGKTDLETEQQIQSKMAGLDIADNRNPIPKAQGGVDSLRSPVRSGDGHGGPGPRGPPGSRGPPKPYAPQDYPEPRRGPVSGTGYGGGYHDPGCGPLERSMTMPNRDPMETRPPAPPLRSETVAYRAGPGPGPGRSMPAAMPPRPRTAQGMRQPTQRMFAPARAQGPGNHHAVSHDAPPVPALVNQRPASLDDFYDSYNYQDYASQKGGPHHQSPARQQDMFNMDAISANRPRNFHDQHAEAGPQQEAPQRLPGWVPEMNRTKSQPDLRNSPTAVFEMAGDAPPMPMPFPPYASQAHQHQQHYHHPHQGLFPPAPPNGRYPGGPVPPVQNFQPPPPGPGLPGTSGAFRAGVSTALPSNSDGLISHPAPVRPGLMSNSIVNLNSNTKPAPVRNYGGLPAADVGATGTSPNGMLPGALLPLSNVARPGELAKPTEPPVTADELERLRTMVKANSQDQETALRLARRLLEAADVLAPNLADPKTRARSRERYLVDAQKILKKLANAGNPEAMFVLADGLGRGLFGAEPDNKEAFTLYMAAAKAGHAAAAYRTAVCCEIGNEEGGGTRKDPLKAIQWYKRAAVLNDVPAMYKVGMILLKGLLGQPRNPREAISWLQRAAELADAENPHALHELGLLYESGAASDGIARDEAYAFNLFQKAADLGYKFSQFRLGCAYEYGLMGRSVDPRLSIMWYSRAAAAGEHQSELALSGWYLTGSEGVLAQSDTEAYLWARKAALAGLAKAEYAMGYFTEVGIGVPASVEDAKRWLWRSAAQDFPKARERLEDLKRSGKGAPRERERISRSKIEKQQEGECSIM